VIDTVPPPTAAVFTTWRQCANERLPPVGVDAETQPRAMCRFKQSDD